MPWALSLLEPDNLSHPLVPVSVAALRSKESYGLGDAPRLE